MKINGADLLLFGIPVVLIFIFQPILVIAGVNIILDATGNNTQIPYTFWTWIGIKIILIATDQLK